jgi:hypothetical protein
MLRLESKASAFRTFYKAKTINNKAEKITKMVGFGVSPDFLSAP